MASNFLQTTIWHSTIRRCPICLKDFLKYKKRIISCTCGIRITMNSTFDSFCDNFEYEVNSHDNHCSANPTFSLIFGKLMMKCRACNTSELIE